MPFDTADTNPLLDLAGLPNFEAIRPEHIAPAIDALLARARAAVAHATTDDLPATWDAVVEPLDDATEALSRAWGTVAHLNAVADTPALREQYNAVLPRVTAFWTELSQNERLFACYKGLAAAPDFGQWPRARRTVIEHELRDFRLGGAELPAEPKARLAAIHERQAQLSTRFAENVLDATNAFALYVEDHEVARKLAGIPSDVLEQYREAAAAEGKGGCKLTLHFPSYGPAMQYAQDRALREQLYRAYATRASEFGPPEWNNSDALLELLRLRREQAALLGYADFAELSLVPKMAQSSGEVLDFLRDLARRCKPYAARDMAELREFAARELNLAELHAWDIAYASEKLREARYAYSEQEVKQYFTETAVLPGLFKLIETLFAVAIRQDNAPTWHPDVKFYRIESLDGTLLAQFYLDLYAREHKQGGAWQDDARARRAAHGRLQTPVSYLTCNFSRPTGGKPALFTHDEVLTLFHEFGHGLHHMLTRVDELSVSGISGVEWDAVELPSQFMENFAWEWEGLQLLTAHVETGAKLPRELFDKMVAAKNFQSGMQFVRQLEFGLTDLRLHTDFEPTDAAALQALVAEVRQEVAVVIPPPFNRMAASFSHIFAGGYAAGYYSYKWAEVLSADAYAAFEGCASRPAMESFVAFRGRKPTMDALLRHNGMDGAPA